MILDTPASRTQRNKRSSFKQRGLWSLCWSSRAGDDRPLNPAPWSEPPGAALHPGIRRQVPWHEGQQAGQGNSAPFLPPTAHATSGRLLRPLGRSDTHEAHFVESADGVASESDSGEPVGHWLTDCGRDHARSSSSHRFPWKERGTLRLLLPDDVSHSTHRQSRAVMSAPLCGLSSPLVRGAEDSGEGEGAVLPRETLINRKPGFLLGCYL